MKRLLLCAALLAATLAQPAGAWVPIGQTPGTDGLQFFNSSGDQAVARHFLTTEFLGSPYIYGATAPEMNWYFPAEVQAALGGAEPIQLRFNAIGNASTNQWTAIAELIYRDILDGSQNRYAARLLSTGTFSFTEVAPGVRAFDIVLKPLNSYYEHIQLPDGTKKPFSHFGITKNFRLTGTLNYVPDYPPAGGYNPAPGGEWYEGSIVLSVQPVPEPVFFQMGALMGLSGLGLLRLRRKA